jgi:histidine triad (HIT) family protein
MQGELVPDDCLFCRMASGAIPVERVAENEAAFAIRDINPRAPVHCLVIPKAHIADARALDTSHAGTLAGLFLLAAEVGRLEGIHESGYRLAFNVGAAAGMTIPHLHLHLLGGRALGPEG